MSMFMYRKHKLVPHSQDSRLHVSQLTPPELVPHFDLNCKSVQLVQFLFVIIFAQV